MKPVCLLDTSIFCEILDVPGLASDARGYQQELANKALAEETLVLPMTTILETGNHIGQNGDGGSRRKAAERFVAQVKAAISGDAPYQASRFWKSEELALWLAGFPDWACRRDAKGKGSGFGDLSLKHEWEHNCELFPFTRVYIWSLDAHLSSYDRLGELP